MNTSLNDFDTLDRDPLRTRKPPGQPSSRKDGDGKYHNLTILGTCIGGGCGSNTNDIQLAYEQALAKYPDPNTCAVLMGYIDAIGTDIASMTQQQTQAASAGGSGRPQSKTEQGWTQRQAELQSLSGQWQCAAFAQQQATNTQLQEGQQQLAYAKNLFSATGNNTTTYVVFGMLGLVVIVSGILIFSK